MIFLLAGSNTAVKKLRDGHCISNTDYSILFEANGRGELKVETNEDGRNYIHCIPCKKPLPFGSGLLALNRLRH